MPTIGVSQPSSSNEPTIRQKVSGTLPLSTCNPRSFGSWPTMITTPMPLMNPISTGRARNSETNPSRRRPAANSTTPVRSARAASSVA